MDEKRLPAGMERRGMITGKTKMKQHKKNEQGTSRQFPLPVLFYPSRSTYQYSGKRGRVDKDLTEAGKITVDFHALIRKIVKKQKNYNKTKKNLWKIMQKEGIM